jgi:pilus assembly protein TadC
MLKGLLRFALIWGISLLLTPYLNRLLDRVAAQAPKGSFLEDALLELSDRYSTSIIRSFGEAVGELVLGSK